MPTGVTLGDQSSWKAQVVGVAADQDLAALRVAVPIPVGTSKELQVGQSVFASDNPFGLDQPLTGVINALGFAIPLGTIARIVPELIRTWKNKQGRVGSELAGEQIIKESRERSFHLDGMRRPSGGKGPESGRRGGRAQNASVSTM